MCYLLGQHIPLKVLVMHDKLYSKISMVHIQLAVLTVIYQLIITAVSDCGWP